MFWSEHKKRGPTNGFPTRAHRVGEPGRPTLSARRRRGRGPGGRTFRGGPFSSTVLRMSSSAMNVSRLTSTSVGESIGRMNSQTVLLSGLSSPGSASRSLRAIRSVPSALVRVTPSAAGRTRWPNATEVVRSRGVVRGRRRAQKMVRRTCLPWDRVRVQEHLGWAEMLLLALPARGRHVCGDVETLDAA